MSEEKSINIRPGLSKYLVRLLTEIKEFDSKIIHIIHDDEYKLALFEIIAVGKGCKYFKEGDYVLSNLYVANEKNDVSYIIDDGNKYYILNEFDIYLSLKRTDDVIKNKGGGDEL